ncbi:protein tyrosine kinase [Ancylostoma duodenale]|uniref:Protein tyrosine kinase n=1 Tax=Ancylostoma duodenale TaxID=51022 RepID=A0A0C2DI42_9BILA|nr:protein tyrosine kinase [Ancylostoma duodenale]
MSALSFKTPKSGNASGTNIFAGAVVEKRTSQCRLYEHRALFASPAKPSSLLFGGVGGSLLEKVRKNKVDMDRKRKYCFQTISGMEYLETQQVIHRDLAARNCLINASDVCKISDFGLSLLGRLHKEKHMVKVPIRWLAPETLKQGTYSNKSDVWSCGVLMFEVFTNGEIPYKEVQALRDVRKKVIGGLRLKPPLDMPAEDAAIMLLCFETEPLARASFAELKARFCMKRTTVQSMNGHRYREVVAMGKKDLDDI